MLGLHINVTFVTDLKQNWLPTLQPLLCWNVVYSKTFERLTLSSNQLLLIFGWLSPQALAAADTEALVVECALYTLESTPAKLNNDKIHLATYEDDIGL